MNTTIPTPAQIRIFDTTLRDGEQSPGCSMTPQQKVVMARGLADLGVDAGPELKATAHAPPAKRSKGVMVKDAAELVAVLKQKGLL